MVKILIKRSDVQDRRPNPLSLEPGELAASTHVASPGLFMRDTSGELVKIGPAFISLTEPVPTNHTSLSKAEFWWDGNTLRIWSGNEWQITNSLSSDVRLPVGLPETTLSVSSETSLIISPGTVFVRDSTGARVLTTLEEPVLKTLSPFLPGAGNGSILGSLATNTWYHVFCIYDSVEGLTDFVLSTSLTPAFPEGYTFRRRIGAILTNGASFVVPFTQIGSSFIWTTPFRDLRGVQVPTTKTNYRLSVPPGINVQVYGSLNPGIAGEAQNLIVNAHNPSVNEAIFSEEFAGFSSQTNSFSTPIVDVNGAGSPLWVTDTNASLAFLSNGLYASNLGSTNFTTYGWNDLGLVRGI